MKDKKGAVPLVRKPRPPKVIPKRTEPDKCKTCLGKGVLYRDASPDPVEIECWTCHGSKKADPPDPVPIAPGSSVTGRLPQVPEFIALQRALECDKCHGSGIMGTASGTATCNKCRGMGTR